MAVTRARVFVHNETDSVLSLVSKEVSDGDWTTAPPDQVEPRSVAVFGTEADGLDPDTEGRATYQIGDGPSQTLYVHWDDPFIGGNAFHTNTDDTHYSFWTASPGRHCEAHFTLRDAGTVMTDFRPSRDGFLFANSFGDVPYKLPPLKGSLLDYKFGNAKSGLCGGMVFAALDYFNAGWRVPQDATAPTDPQMALFQFFVDRLFATFSVDSISLMLALINPGYPDGDESMLSDLGLASGRAAVMAHEEWPLLRADIDAGRPSPMFITTVKSLNPFDLGECHQILAYGYDAHGHDVTIHVYDPNTPGPTSDSVQLTINDGDVSQRIVVTHNVNVTDDDDCPMPIYCFGRMDYGYVQPPEFTGQRIPSFEADHRGTSVVVGDPVTVSSMMIDSGTRTYDVWPDCGEHDFEYTDFEDTQRITVTGQPHGYYTPSVNWRVGGHAVADGADGDLLMTGTPEGSTKPVTVTVHVHLLDDVLTLTNHPKDGNFSVTVDVRTREGAAPADPGRSWSTLASFTGARERVDGLAEAMSECMAKYISAHQAGEPDFDAELAAIYAQLRRPPDPLWDPDPVMIDAGALVAARQPELEELKELSAIPEVTHQGPDLDPGHAPIDPHHVLTPEEVAAQAQKQLEKLQKQLGGELGGFS